MVMAAAAWYARGHVVRPIRIVALVAIGGAAIALPALAGLSVPRAFLGMAAALALACSVNQRLTQRPRRPLVRRGAWIAAAAVMLAAMPNDVPREGGAFTVRYTTIDLAIAAVVAGLVVAVVIRIARGIAADRGDRLLAGALGAIVVYIVLWITAIPQHLAAWNYPFWILLGAADARAYGNIRRP
jgi:hypothetical protein